MSNQNTGNARKFKASAVNFALVRNEALRRAEELVRSWLPEGKREGREWVALNPRRQDKSLGSFRINLETGQWCDHADAQAFGTDLIGLRAHLQQSNQVEAAIALAETLGLNPFMAEDGLTLEAYAEAKGLDIDALRKLGLETIPDPWGRPREVLSIPYWRRDGSLLRHRLRVALEKPADGSPRMLWDKNVEAGISLYGLEQLPPEGCPVFLVEGESDCHALWSAGWDAAGAPGAKNYSPARDDAELDGRDVIALVEEDGGGEELLKRLSRSRLREAMRAVMFKSVAGCEDASELRRTAAARFDGVMRRIIETAEPLEALLKRRPELDAARTPNGGAAGKEPRPSLPEGFRYLKDGAIEYLTGTKTEDGEEIWAWLCSPLEVLAETRGEDERNWGLLIRVKTPDGKWHTQPIPRAAFSTQSEDVIAMLANLGVKFVPSSAAKGRLKALLALSKSDKRARTATHVGWHGPKIFVLPDEVFGENSGERVVFQPEKPTPHAYRLGGSFEGWRKEVAERALGNSRLEFGASAAFAGPFLQLLDMEGGGFHYRGDGSTGKTSALWIAGSAWGGGGLSGFFHSWRATDNGLEGRALTHSDAIFLLDELGLVSGLIASRTVYMLANGQGKTRAGVGGEARPAAEFRILFLSTGEMTLAAKLGEEGQQVMAGQETRFIDLEADAGAGMGVFEDIHGFQGGARFCEAIRQACNAHHGHAAREFLRRLLADMDGARQKIREGMDAFISRARLDDATGQVQRVARRFALVGAAGEIAAGWGITPWPDGRAMKAAERLFREWRARRGTDGALEGVKAVEQVRAMIEKHGAARFVPWDAPQTPVINRLGFVRREGDALTYYVLPQMFREEICKGLDPARVARELARIGALTPDNQGKMSRLAKLPGMGAARCYVIDAAKLFADVVM